MDSGNASLADPHTEQNKKSAWYDPIVWFTGLLFIATAGSAAVLAQQWHTLEKTDRTLNATLVATQRPWIKVGFAKAISPLHFERGDGEVGGGVTLLFTLENVGKSPAIKPTINTRLAFTFDPQASQRSFCNAIKQDRDHPVGSVLRPENAIFPTDKSFATSLAWTDRDEMKLAIQRAANMPDNKADFLSIIGCVFYDFTFTEGSHQTGIMLGLTKKIPYPNEIKPAWYSNVPVDRFVPNLVSYNPDRISDGIRLEGEIPADDLSFKIDTEGAGPID
jgi:hypothetical protein